MSKTKKNRSVREELERIYGKHCMIHEGIRKLKRPEPKKAVYKGKSIANQITLHHLKPRREGGATTLQNGALICRKCHDWLEQLPQLERERVNDELRAYKASFDIHCAILIPIEKGIEFQPVAQTEEVEMELPPEIEAGEIELEPMTPEEQAQYEKYKRQKIAKQYRKFGVETAEQKLKREQKELLEDLEMEFNERNRGGYGR